MSTSKPNAQSNVHIACVFPLAGIGKKGVTAPVEDMYSEFQRVGEQFHKALEKTYPKYKSFPFSSIRWKGEYGGLVHIYHLEDDIVDVANELYVYLCHQKDSLEKVFIVAVESGAFITARLLQFIKIYGLNIEIGMGNFAQLWGALIAGQEFERPSEPAQYNLEIDTVILIRPCLPAPKCIASLAWRIIVPKFYKNLIFNPGTLPCKRLFWVNGESNAGASALFIDMVLDGNNADVVKVKNADKMIELIEDLENTV